MRAPLGAILALIVGLACGGETERPAPAAPSVPEPAVPELTVPEPAVVPEPAPPTTAPAPEAVPATPPGPAVPTGSLRGDPKAGEAVYAGYCTPCHGRDGKGEGLMAVNLNPSPRDFTDAEYMGSLSDEHLFTVIQKGGAAVGRSPLMAPWGGVISEEDTKDLIAYLRTLSGT